MQIEAVPFQSSSPLTLGAEVEVQLVASDDNSLSQRGPELYETFPWLKSELYCSVLEVVTDPCRDAGEIRSQLLNRLGQLNRAVAARGLALLVAGTHPFSCWESQEVSPVPRYQQVIEEFQWVAKRLLTYGLHLHVGVSSADEAIQVMRGLLGYLPLFLALSANSPFFNGRLTGLESSRAKVFEGIPHAGLPPVLADWEEYVWVAQSLKQAGRIQSVRDLRWDLRPHPLFGTVEIRICDAPARVEEMVFLAALAQTLVARLLVTPVAPPHPVVLVENRWRASRHGLAADLVTRDGEQVLPARKMIEQVLEELWPTAQSLRTDGILAQFGQLWGDGNGAERQLKLLHDLGSPHRVAEELVKQWRGEVVGEPA